MEPSDTLAITSVDHVHHLNLPTVRSQIVVQMVEPPPLRESQGTAQEHDLKAASLKQGSGDSLEANAAEDAGISPYLGQTVNKVQELIRVFPVYVAHVPQTEPEPERGQKAVSEQVIPMFSAVLSSTEAQRPGPAGPTFYATSCCACGSWNTPHLCG